MKSLYVDNYAVLSVDKEVVEKGVLEMKECLDGYRVQSSLEDDAPHEHIGFTLFKGTIWRPTDKTF